MKNIRLLILFLFCLSATATWGQEEIYDKYAARDSLLVAYVTDYWLDSANRIDIIFIETKDSAKWESLLVEFCSEERVRNLDLSWGSEGFSTYTADSKDPTKLVKPSDADSVCLVNINLEAHNICLFFLTDYKRQMNIIITRSVKKAKQYAEEKAKRKE